MTNEQKAKEFYHKYRELNLAPESAAFNAALEMAEWKEQQMIEKVLAYLNNKFYFDNIFYGVVSTDFNSMEEMFEDFKQAMKGE